MYKRWRVYSTFLTGICIGLAYALLIGNPWSWGLAETAILIEWKVLLLTFSGILGGVIYAIVVNGEVEMPQFVIDQGALFKAGLFGDILLGIAGAFILELLLPSSLSVMENAEPGGTAVAATGIIGGYGGRAIIKFSLERFFKYTGALYEVRDAAIIQHPSQQKPRAASLEAAVTKNSTSSDGSVSGSLESKSVTANERTLLLIEHIDSYVQRGLSDPERVQLIQQMQSEPTSVRQEVFTALIELRQEIAASLEAEQLQRMAGVLDGLISVSPSEHPLYYQLALIQTGLMPPAYESALAALNKAIALRGSLTIGQPWQYELHRAVVNIKQGQAATADFTMSATAQDAILSDLLEIARVYNLDSILQAADQQQIPIPVVNWIRHNQALLLEREETRPLMNSLRSILVGSPLRPIGNASSSLGPKRSDISESSSKTAPQDAVFPEIFSALGRCYDILYLDPFNILGNESAKVTQVFDFYPQEAHPELDEKETILIPIGTRYIPGSNGRMHIDSQSNLLYTESDVQKMLSGTLGASLRIED